MNLTGDRNQCRGCAEFFNSTFAFDKHRTGEHGVDRRCRTPEEMLAKGMCKNAAGFWITEPSGREFGAEKGDDATTPSPSGENGCLAAPTSLREASI